MNFGWENEKERLKRYMNMPPKKKLELLYELSRFTQKYLVNNVIKVRKKSKAA